MLIDLSLEVNPHHAHSEISKMGHFGTHIVQVFLSPISFAMPS